MSFRHLAIPGLIALFFLAGLRAGLAVQCDDKIIAPLSSDPHATDVLPVVAAFLCTAPSITLVPPYDVDVTPAYRNNNCPAVNTSITRADARIIGIAILSNLGKLQAYEICIESQPIPLGWAVSHNAATTTLTLSSQPTPIIRVVGIYGINTVCKTDSVGNVVSGGTAVQCNDTTGSTSTSVFVELNSGTVVERSYDKPTEPPLPGCADPNPQGANQLQPDPAFSQCAAKAYPPISGASQCASQFAVTLPPYSQCLLQIAQTQCNSAGSPQQVLTCMRQITCREDAIINLTQFETFRLTCSRDGSNSAACNEYAQMSANALTNASPDMVVAQRCTSQGPTF